MPATYTEARDDILTLFKNAWEGNLSSASFPIAYQNQPFTPPKTKDSNGDPNSWCRITVIHATGQQISLRGPSGQRFQRNGTVFIQIFTPFGIGTTLVDILANIASKAFEGKATPNGVWFRNTRVNEIGQDGDWFQTNVLTDFEYDEIR